MSGVCGCRGASEHLNFLTKDQLMVAENDIRPRRRRDSLYRPHHDFSVGSPRNAVADDSDPR